MRKFVFLTIVLLLSSMSYAQYWKVEYSAVLRQELSEEEKQEILNDNEYGRDQIKMNEEPDPAYYELLIGNKASAFTYVERISNEQDEDKPVIIQAPAGFGTTYKNLDRNEIRKDFDVYGKKYHSIDPLENWDWTISRESEKVLGFEIRKAISETEEYRVTAWYAPKINIPDGPAEFWGLPGLILIVEKESKKHPVLVRYYAESIQSLKKEPKMNIPNKGETIKAAEIGALFDEVNRQREEMYRDSSGIDKD